MKKLLSLLVLSTLLLTACNNGKADSDNSSAKEISSTSVTTASSSTTTTKAESTTTVTSISGTASSESNAKTDSDTLLSKETESEAVKDTERETVDTAKENNGSGQDEQTQNDEKSSNSVRENDEGDIIVIAPEISEGETVEKPERSGNDDDFQIITEAPIELPFIPAG